MLVKILGGIDIIAGLALMFGAGFSFPYQVYLIFGMILLAKSLLGFLKDFASWIDFLSGLIFLLAMIPLIPGWISVIFGILLLQKGVFSFL